VCVYVCVCTNLATGRVRDACLVQHSSSTDARYTGVTTVLTLLSHCCNTALTLVLHYCYIVILLLHCCYTIVALLSHYCYTVVALSLHCCSCTDHVMERVCDASLVPHT
jgi:hypothetical protein